MSQAMLPLSTTNQQMSCARPKSQAIGARINKKSKLNNPSVRNSINIGNLTKVSHQNNYQSPLALNCEESALSIPTRNFDFPEYNQVSQGQMNKSPIMLNTDSRHGFCQHRRTNSNVSLSKSGMIPNKQTSSRMISH